MSNGYEQELSVAIEAVRAASRVCRSVRGEITPDVLEKKDKSPVTVADFASQAVVCRALAEAFPTDPVIGEEDAKELREGGRAPLLDKVVGHVRTVAPDADGEAVCGWIDHGGASEQRERFWTLDPIDGTKGFLRNEQYAVALALIEGGRIRVGVLGCPNMPIDPGSESPAGLLFTAVAGSGSRSAPLEGEASPRAIEVSETSEPASAQFCESVESGHSSHSDADAVASHLGITQPPLRRDSQAKYATVARGEADIYLRLPTRADYVEKIWDHAAGALVTAEAGGTVTDITGKPLSFTHGAKLQENRGVVVTNGRFHDRVIAAIAAAGVK